MFLTLPLHFRRFVLREPLAHWRPSYTMASSLTNPLKRLGFKRTNTTDAQVVDGKVANTSATEWTDRGDADASKIAQEFAKEPKHDHSDTSRNLSEVEANLRLNKFREEHNFDPNLPDSAFDAIKDVTQTHNLDGEAVLVDELLNDSPYPEVSKPLEYAHVHTNRVSLGPCRCSQL